MTKPTIRELARCIHENIGAAPASRITLADASSERLALELVKRAENATGPESACAKSAIDLAYKRMAL